MTAPRHNEHSDPYRELFERSADAILIIEGDTFVDCNQATVDMLRYRSKVELLQTHPSQLSPATQPDGRSSFEKANEMIAIAFARGSHRFEWDHQRANGEVFPVEVLLTAITEGPRRMLHVVWRDISGRRQLEDELRHVLKLEAVGKLTGGIAHDFNNLLVAVMGNAELLEEEVANQPEALRLVRAIAHAGERAADLVHQLLVFGRKQVLRPTVLDLNQLTTQMHVLLQRLVGERVRVTYRLADGVLPIEADRSQIEQILTNLAANARDAMAANGELAIETARVVLTTEDVLRERDLVPGEFVALRVVDNGSGMDAATAARAFDPFFTTKPVGSGTGLGLSTVHGIARQSGGAVSLRSEPGIGTMVEILLPMTRRPLAKPTTPLPRPTPRRGAATILVAEDEVVVAQLVRRALEGRGYRVLVAPDGLAALARFESGQQIDLLVSDVIMPSLGGPELVRELRRRGHAPRVLLMSGYTGGRLERSELGDGTQDFLEKPFRLSQLIERVEALLAAPREREAGA